MPVTPTGYLAVPFAALRATVAASATFQEVVGAADAAEAKLSIYLQLGDDELEPNRAPEDPKLKHPRPRAVVATANDWVRDRKGAAEWQPASSLWLSFEFPIPAEYAGVHNDEALWFLNQVGAILAEMEAARDADTEGLYLPFHRLAFLDDPMPGDDDLHVENFWGATLVVTYQ